MNSVLVTGVSGFVGSALSRRLLSDGWHVRGTIRSAEGSGRIPPGVEVVRIPMINRATDWSKVLAGINTVVHLAARVHVMSEASRDPLGAFREVNVAGTERLARAAARAGVNRLLFMSSVKVNGERTYDRPFTETDIPAPEDPYGMSKREAEEVLHRISTETGLDVVILRPPLVYGPGVKANFLRLLRFIDRNIPLPLGTIKNRRSMIYLENLVDAVVVCCSHDAARKETFLVSDGEDISTPELIRMIGGAMGKKVLLFPFPLSFLRILLTLTGKRAEVDRLVGTLCIDIHKMKKTLSWNPPFSMKEGIERTVAWYTSHEGA